MCHLSVGEHVIILFQALLSYRFSPPLPHLDFFLFSEVPPLKPSSYLLQCLPTGFFLLDFHCKCFFVSLEPFIFKTCSLFNCSHHFCLASSISLKIGINFNFLRHVYSFSRRHITIICPCLWQFYLQFLSFYGFRCLT